MGYLGALISRLTRRITRLEDKVSEQKDRISELESDEDPTIHEMEVVQQHQIEEEVRKRGELSNHDLRVVLEKQYGHTKWAKKLINEILATRKELRDNSNTAD